MQLKGGTNIFNFFEVNRISDQYLGVANWWESRETQFT